MRFLPWRSSRKAWSPWHCFALTIATFAASERRLGAQCSSRARLPRSPIWFAVMLAFFSLGGNKGDYYLVVMPAFVPSIAERIGRTRFRLELVPSVWLVVIAVLWMRIPL